MEPNIHTIGELIKSDLIEASLRPEHNYIVIQSLGFGTVPYPFSLGVVWHGSTAGVVEGKCRPDSQRELLG